MSTQPQLPADNTTSYFTRRMLALGIAPEINKIELWQNGGLDDDGNAVNKLVTYPIFEGTDKGIDILVYSLGRMLIKYAGEGSRWKHHTYKMTRLEVPIVTREGNEIKYLIPKGQATQPFFPPGLVARYDKCNAWKLKNPGKPLPDKLKLKVLYMTEGYFKAFKADMHGISCVGLSSITHMKNKETGALHEDIITLLTACDVERFVWLTDGDCRDITSKELQEGTDLYKRPNQFFTTIRTFSDLTSKLDIRKYWAYVNSAEMRTAGQPGPKGIDDMLCALPGEIDKIAADYNDFSQNEFKGVCESRYIYRYDLDRGLNNVKRYLLLNDIDEFYLYHIQKRQEISQVSFKYNGSIYKYKESDKPDEPGRCQVEIPGAAERYFRVGDHYYEWIHIPNKFGETVRTYKPRKKETINDDHRRKHKFILDHIVKYHDFCIVPDHINYQNIIHNCFNRYLPLPHTPEKGECPVSLEFVKHIFGDHPVTIDNGGGDVRTVPYYELGLDYISILYHFPQQVLPILCLVSKENNTGKSTFLDWLNFIFIENMIQVGNEDLANPFNAYWTSKLIVACDETKVDKQLVFEKIKRLATSGSNISQGKGTNQELVDSFLKFIFCSNNEDTFVNISSRDIRFWVLKVKPFTTENTEMRADLRDEIDQFLYFIANRQMVTKKKARHWFDTQLLKTEALERLIQNTKPSMERRIRTEIAELFDMMPDCDHFYMPLEGLAVDVLKKADKNYVKRTLNDMGYEAVKTTTRGQYPRRQEKTLPGAIGSTQVQQEIGIQMVSFLGKPYLFKREDFTDKPDPACLPTGMASIAGNDDAAGNTAGNDCTDPNKDLLPF